MASILSMGSICQMEPSSRIIIVPLSIFSCIQWQLLPPAYWLLLLVLGIALLPKTASLKEFPVFDKANCPFSVSTRIFSPVLLAIVPKNSPLSLSNTPAVSEFMTQKFNLNTLHGIITVHGATPVALRAPSVTP